MLLSMNFSKKKGYERALQVKYSSQSWNTCRLIPAHLAVLQGTELASLSTWQERRPTHGLKLISFFNGFTSEIAPHNTSHHVSPVLKNTWTWSVQVSKTLIQPKLTCTFLIKILY